MLFFLVQESAGRMVSSERGMGDEMNHSLFATCLKTLKMAKGSYWLKLAWIWDRRHVRLGSAPNARVEPRSSGHHPGARYEGLQLSLVIQLRGRLDAGPNPARAEHGSRLYFLHDPRPGSVATGNWQGSITWIESCCYRSRFWLWCWPARRAGGR